MLSFSYNKFCPGYFDQPSHAKVEELRNIKKYLKKLYVNEKD
jgi:hypothetical protein